MTPCCRGLTIGNLRGRHNRSQRSCAATQSQLNFFAGPSNRCREVLPVRACLRFGRVLSEKFPQGNNRELAMKGLIFAIGALALGCAATTPGWPATLFSSRRPGARWGAGSAQKKNWKLCERRTFCIAIPPASCASRTNIFLCRSPDRILTTACRFDFEGTHNLAANCQLFPPGECSRWITTLARPFANFVLPPLTASYCQ